MNKYTTNKPTQPGWYWCFNPIDNSEFICRIDHSEVGLMCAWMTEPGKAGLIHESQWAPTTQWAGPIQGPQSTIYSTRGSK